MELHFPWPEVAKALAELRAATVVRLLYEQATGKGLWLVGDEGVLRRHSARRSYSRQAS